MRKNQFQRQAEFTQRYLRKRYGFRPSEGEPAVAPSDEEKVELTKEYVLNLHREVDEILDEVPWKMHRVYDGSGVVRSNVAEEIVDLLKYATGLAHIWGLTYEELCEEIDIKSDVVEDRWRQEHDASAFQQSEAPIALLDLDGVLNEYPGPFIRFVNEHNSGIDLSTMAKIEEAPYLKARMKHLYRQSGIKRTLPRIDTSVIAAQMLKARGYAIVIMSQRPAEGYHRIYGDTLYWLRRNEVPYDRLIFVPDKQHKLVLAPYLPRIKLAVDDDPKVVLSLLDLGITNVYWLTPSGSSPLAAYDSAAKAHIVTSMLEIPEVYESTDAFRKEVRYGGSDPR